MQETFSVSQLNNYLKSVVESDFVLSNVLVRGEISNFKTYSSGGQWYFTLKDQDAQLSCVVFENFTQKIKFTPKDGDKVVAKGKVSIFNRRGTYNLQVFYLEPEGLGALAKAFQELKEKLAGEGLFAVERKKQIPLFPQRIAVLAATQGAAVQDIIHVAQRRNSAVELVVLPTIVQGSGSIDSLVSNIKLANELKFDVLILARGGGSLEDLWSFNEEKVARAIVASKIPVVSAVGHEVDYTIADFVADLRAATPSVAAELVVPDIVAWQDKVRNWQEQLVQGLNRLTSDIYQQIDYVEERLKENFAYQLEQIQNKYQQLTGRLEDLNPLSVLRRGYSLVELSGEPVTAKGLKKSDIIDVVFQDGRAQAEVLKVTKGKK